MMQSRGYFFAGLQSGGLIRIPSITVPSLLVHETTSRVPRMNGLTWPVRRVRTLGEKVCASATNTSGRLTGDPAVNARFRPSRVKENDPAIRSSGLEILVIFALAGSTRKRWEAVFCKALK